MTVSGRIKQSFLDGVLLILPFVVVAFVLSLLVNWATIIVNPIVRETRLVNYTSNIEVLAQIIALVVVFCLIVVLGFAYSSNRSTGWRRKFGRFIDFIPLLGTIYLSVRQVAASISDTGGRFKRLVVLEYPRENIYRLGLVTSSGPEIPGKQDLVSVFLPNSPNPTGGEYVVVPEDEIIEIDMSVQKGLKLVMTMGIAFRDDEIPVEIRNESS